MATVAGTGTAAPESGGWWAMLRGGTVWHAMPSWLALRAVCGIPVLEVLARQEHAPERGRCRRCAGLAHPAATVTRGGEPAGDADNAGNQEG